MSWHTEQWNALGAWVSGIGSLAAVGASLWLASDARRVRLRVRVGISWLRSHGGSSADFDLISVGVTNLADRPVTVTEVGWVIGRRSARPFAGQNISNRITGLKPDAAAKVMHTLPLRLERGQQGNFATELTRGPWPAHIADFVGDSPLKTLRGRVTTSTGVEVTAPPAQELIERIQNVLDARKVS